MRLFASESGSKMKLKGINASYLVLLRHTIKVFKQSPLCTLGFCLYVNNLISAGWLLVLTSPTVRELGKLTIWPRFKFPGLKRQHPPSLKRRLLRDLGHFYHRTHYANRQSRGPLCQRAAAAFRGSVQDHQVLMSQERNQHIGITHFIPAHSSELYMQHSGAPLLSAHLYFLCV